MNPVSLLAKPFLVLFLFYLCLKIAVPYLKEIFSKSVSNDQNDLDRMVENAKLKLGQRGVNELGTKNNERNRVTAEEKTLKNFTKDLFPNIHLIANSTKSHNLDIIETKLKKYSEASLDLPSLRLFLNSKSFNQSNLPFTDAEVFSKLGLWLDFDNLFENSILPQKIYFIFSTIDQKVLEHAFALYLFKSFDQLSSKDIVFSSKIYDKFFIHTVKKLKSRKTAICEQIMRNYQLVSIFDLKKSLSFHIDQSTIMAPLKFQKTETKEEALDVLGMKKIKSSKALKEHYFYFAKILHPDKRALYQIPSELESFVENKFRVLTEAYEILKASH